jgi:hypothetical protein
VPLQVEDVTRHRLGKLARHLKLGEQNVQHELLVDLCVVEELGDEQLRLFFLRCLINLRVLAVEDAHLLADYVKLGLDWRFV